MFCMRCRDNLESCDTKCKRCDNKEPVLKIYGFEPYAQKTE